MRSVAVGLLAAAGLCGQDLPRQDPSRQADRIVTIGGERIAGRVRSFVDGRLVVAIENGETRNVPLDEVVEVRRSGTPRPVANQGPAALLLRSGPRLAGRVVRAEGDRIVFRAEFDAAPVGEPAVFTLKHLRALRLSATIGDDEGFQRALESPAKTRDLLFATNRETGAVTRLSLRVIGFGDDVLEVEFGGRTNAVPLAQVLGIVFGTDNGLRPEPLPKPVVSVSPAGGPQLRGTLVAWSADTVSVRIAEGATFGLPIESIAGLVVDGGRLAYLSNLAPSKVDQTPAFDRTKPWMRDATQLGPGIELGGRTYEKGLCLVPRAALSFSLAPGEFDVFEAVVGIDDRSGDQAHAIFRVRIDDEVVFTSEPMTHGAKPVPVHIEIAGASRLTLETDFGKNFDIGDHCVFADARLLKN